MRIERIKSGYQTSSFQYPTYPVTALIRTWDWYRVADYSGVDAMFVNRSAFIATNPEALLPHSIAPTPPLGANLPTPNSLRRGAGLGGPELGSLDCEYVFESAASNGGAQDPS